MAIHEPNDEFFRPTNQAWKCPKCGQKLFTVSCIVSHKERCIDTPNVEKPKPQHEIEHKQKLKNSLEEFKKQHRI